MQPKTKRAIATWVATAVGRTIPIEGQGSTVDVSASYVANAGNYETVLVQADGLSLPLEERFAATVDDREVQFMALEDRGNDEYLLRVTVD